MIINTDAGLKEIFTDRKHNKGFLRASLCFYTSDDDLYFEKIEDFNLTHRVACSNTAELLASLSAFKKYHDKLDKIRMYTDCPLLPEAQRYYQSAQGNIYKDPLQSITHIVMKHGLKKELDIFVEAIKKAKIEKVPGHSGIIENEYVDTVCNNLLNDKPALSFNEFLNVFDKSIFIKNETMPKKMKCI